jgi:hypothetical protein
MWVKSGRLGGEGYGSYSFLTLTLDGVNGQLHAPATLYPRVKEPRYPLDRKLDGPQNWYEHRGYRKNPFVSAVDRTPIAWWSSP